jgi:hypothetical protein
MEEQGVDRRCSRRRSRLLDIALIRVAACVATYVLACLLTPHGSLFAQDEDVASGGTPPVAATTLPEAVGTVEAAQPAESAEDQSDANWFEITFSSPSPVSNVPWTITFLVDYPYPPGVLVHPPEFPEELALEEVRVEPRLVLTAAGERRSAVRFTFIPQRAAQVTLGPFEVRTPQRSAITAEVPVAIEDADPGAGTRHPYLTWESGKNGFTIGEGGELFMRLHDWDDARKRPQNLFRFDVPEHAIIEEHPLTQAETARNIVLHLTLIPLEGSEIMINRHRFQHEGYTLEIPQLHLRVAPKEADHSQQSAAARDAQNARDASGALYGKGENATLISARDAASGIPFSVPFPDFSIDMGNLLHVLRKADVFGIDSRIEEAKTLWRQRQTAEALAVIRKTERDHTLGLFFVNGRRELEQLVALEPIHDETWMPKNLCFVLFLCAFAVLSFFIALGLLKKRWKIIPIIVMAVLSPAFFFAFAGIAQPKKAVLHDADAFYVPEMKGEIQNHFNEGQCVFARSISGDWVFVETFDNRTGWVRLENVVFY